MSDPICEECNWSNTGLLNLGGLDENGAVNRWVCHGCCKRVIEQRDTLSSQLATLEAKLARRDAAFAALVDANAELVGAMSRLLEYARFGHHVEDKEKFEAAHDKGREALKLAEGVEG